MSKLAIESCRTLAPFGELEKEKKGCVSFMNGLEEITQLVIKYLEQSTQPIGALEWFNQYGVVLIQTFILVAGSLAGLYKYYSTKNKEIHEKILTEVYSPLFQYLIKQETYCFIHDLNRDISTAPILEIKTNKTTFSGRIAVGEQLSFNTTTSSETVLGLNRYEFLKVLESINIGLASKELFTLLSIYQVLIYAEEKNDELSEAYLKSTIMKVDIEKAISKEIIKGYNHYHKKLGLKKLTDSQFYKIENDEIKFNYKVDDDVKNKLKSELTEKANY